MNLEAIEGVRDLVLRYVDAINSYDLDEFADTFASDATWDVRGRFSGQGREHIKETFKTQISRSDWIFQVVHGTRVLKVADETATARSYIAEHGHRGGAGHYMFAVYQDECVRQDGVWRFAHRVCDALYYGPPDLSAPLLVYPAPKYP